MLAFAVKRTHGFYSVIALWMGSEGSIDLWQSEKKLFVVIRDDWSHIRHRAIANFNIVFIAFLIEPMVFREMLCD